MNASHPRDRIWVLPAGEETHRFRKGGKVGPFFFGDGDGGGVVGWGWGGHNDKP